MDILTQVAEQFAISGSIQKVTQIHKGYINQTYVVETEESSAKDAKKHCYTFQKINENVFPNIDHLMENYVLTTEHLRDRLFLPGQTCSVQTVIPTQSGAPYLRTREGCFRMMTYFDNVYSLDIPDSPRTFYYAGRAFGGFLKGMADISAEKIHEVIPNFHNTYSRYLDLEKAVQRDAVGRLSDVDRELRFVRSRRALFGKLHQALSTGLIPTRVCHNDCNLNNVLFDCASHLPVALIDMDTVMPSSPLYDFGDSMRIGTNTAKDDEKDLRKVSCDLTLYKEYARGYLEEAGPMLMQAELELLPLAALTITSEDGIRFLMDYIDGDTYYITHYPEQNLDRARTQLTLLADMERKLPQMVEILNKIYGELSLGVRLDAAKVLGMWQVAE